MEYPFSGDRLTGGSWQMNLQTLNPILSPPPEGLLKIDLTFVLTFSHNDPFGNPRSRSESQGVRTLALPGTLSRTQYSSVINHWLYSHSALEAYVANGFTGAVIEYAFQNYVNIRGKIEVHVAAELEYLIYEEQPEMDQVEDVNKGLCTYCINLLRDEYVCLVAAEGDCSICLEKLVPAGGDEKFTNYLLFHRRSQIWMWIDT